MDRTSYYLSTCYFHYHRTRCLEIHFPEKERRRETGCRSSSSSRKEERVQVKSRSHLGPATRTRYGWYQTQPIHKYTFTVVVVENEKLIFWKLACL
jgi:hypothetical protein